MSRSLTFVSILALAAAAADPSLYRRGPQSKEAPSGLEAKPFEHRHHVRQRWGRDGEPEYDRDCRGCHQFRAKDDPSPALDPQALCSACHEGGTVDIDVPETAAEFRRNLEALRDPARVFDHGDHLSERCDSCHSPVAGGRAGEQGEMYMARGWQTCLVCHDPAAEGSPSRNDPALVAKFLEGINAKLTVRAPDPGARFDHRTHLPAGRPLRESDCMECHGGIDRREPLAWGAESIDPSACALCHISDGSRTPLPMGFSRRTMASRTKGTFPHGPHTGPEAASKDPAIRDQGCFACHATLEDGRTYGLDERWERDAYGACTSCHAHQGPGWQLLDEAGRPDHGRVESCAPCHTFGEGDMKSSRPFASIARPVASTFVFLGQQHPLITPGAHGPGVAESCKPCHRAETESGLPSRIRGRRFSHDTHLPANPTDADCLQCHGSVVHAADPSELLVVETRSCDPCHRGSPVQVEWDDPAPARRVPAFPHALHLTESARALGVEGCASCHTAVQGGVPSVGVHPSAADCTACHDHGTSPRITGGKDRLYVSSCRHCHGDAGLAAGTPVEDIRLSLAGIPGGQFHPSPGEIACAQCHRSRGIEFEARERAHVWAELGYGPRFHNPDRPAAPDSSCYGCHWAEIMDNRPLQGFRGSRRDAVPLGSRLDSFPGRPR